MAVMPRLLLALLICLPLTAAAREAPAAPHPHHRLANATAPEPRPFTATYRLEVSGWPSTTVAHRLEREGQRWFSEMQAAIALARGHERSRFLIEPQGVRSLHYAAGYSLLGLGGDYRLTPDDLTPRPDRQAALFELSRRALAGRCPAEQSCRLSYQDHRGRTERIDYRVLGPTRLSLPAGDFEALAVEVTEPERPERRLVFGFHPELPGLLLSVEYHRDGQRRSRLSLAELSLLD